jgi:hypothetical protein
MNPAEFLSLYLLVALAAFLAFLWIRGPDSLRLLRTWRRRLRFSLAALLGVLTFTCVLVAVMRLRTPGEWADTIFVAAPLMITAYVFAVAVSYLLWDCFVPERWKNGSLVMQRKRLARRKPQIIAAPGERISQGAFDALAHRRE